MLQKQRFLMWPPGLCGNLECLCSCGINVSQTCQYWITARYPVLWLMTASFGIVVGLTVGSIFAKSVYKSIRQSARQGHFRFRNWVELSVYTAIVAIALNGAAFIWLTVRPQADNPQQPHLLSLAEAAVACFSSLAQGFVALLWARVLVGAGQLHRAWFWVGLGLVVLLGSFQALIGARQAWVSADLGLVQASCLASAVSLLPALLFGIRFLATFLYLKHVTHSPLSAVERRYLLRSLIFLTLVVAVQLCRFALALELWRQGQASENFKVTQHIATFTASVVALVNCASYALARQEPAPEVKTFSLLSEEWSDQS